MEIPSNKQTQYITTQVDDVKKSDSEWISPSQLDSLKAHRGRCEFTSSPKPTLLQQQRRGADKTTACSYNGV